MKKILITVLTLLMLIPQSIRAEDTIDLSPLYLYSSNYVLIDQDTGDILASKNSDKQIYPASITKALTLITALELLDKTPLSTQYTVPEEVFTGLSTIASTADFQIGDTLPLSDYLYGIILPSGADATRILSMYLTKTPEGLSTEMNKLAAKIGMKNSHFVNTSGLDEENHYSTVEDLALMIQYALKNETFKDFYTKVEHTTSPTPKHPEGIQFTNLFLEAALEADFPELYGAKSGYTELAERSLSSVAKKGELNLIFVSTNAPRETKLNTHLLDAINVYKQAFHTVQKVNLQKNGDFFGLVDIKYRAKKLALTASYDVKKLVSADLDLTNFDKTFIPTPNLVAPLEKGQVLGTIIYSKDDIVLFEEEILAPEAIQKSLRYKILDFAIAGLKFLAGLVIIVIIAIVAIRRYNLYKIRKRRQEMGWVRRKK